MTTGNRLILAAASMLAVAAVFVLNNAYAPRHDTCADPERLHSAAFFDGASHLKIRVDPEPDQPLWVDGTFASGSLSDNTYFFRFVRSYDVARFIQSGILLLRNFALPKDGKEQRTLEIDGRTVPIRLRVRLAGNSPFVSGYIAAIGNEPVASPVWGTLRQIFDAPFSGPKPISILVIESPRPQDGLATQEAFILEWLTAAWREFRRTCAPANDA